VNCTRHHASVVACRWKRRREFPRAGTPQMGSFIPCCGRDAVCPMRGTAESEMDMIYREARTSDVPPMARIRALTWGDVDYWIERISRYMDGTNNPREALPARVLYVATDDDSLTGMIAGHLTRRHGCDGELEWIDVPPAHRGTGVATELLDCLARWFVAQHALRICVDVEPNNVRARRFYTRCGAKPLNPHWLVWDDIGCRFSGGNSD
jgi:GNAT superfamily N-acetyltransferase